MSAPSESTGIFGTPTVFGGIATVLVVVVVIGVVVVAYRSRDKVCMWVWCGCGLFACMYA